VLMMKRKHYANKLTQDQLAGMTCIPVIYKTS
jgi:hypothetical protein